MRTNRCSFPAVLATAALFFAACGGPSGAATVEAMEAAIAALMANPEQPDEAITLQHVLITFRGAPKATVNRSKDDARALAVTVWGQARAGADFKALMKANSNDPGPGEYPMTKAGRAGMVAAFGNVGFRLKVGEIGVAPYDPKDSPFGWHIIKRVK